MKGKKRGINEFHQTLDHLSDAITLSTHAEGVLINEKLSPWGVCSKKLRQVNMSKKAAPGSRNMREWMYIDISSTDWLLIVVIAQVTSGVIS